MRLARKLMLQRSVITLVGVHQVSHTSSSSTLVFTTPAGTQSGDLLLAFLMSAGGPTWSNTASFVEDLDASGRGMNHLKLTSSPAASYTFTSSSSSQTPAGIFMVYRNADFDVIGTVGTATNCPAATASQSNSRVLVFSSSGTANITYTADNGFGSPIYNYATATAPSYGVFSKSQALAGSTGTTTITRSSNVVTNNFHYILKPS